MPGRNPHPLFVVQNTALREDGRDLQTVILQAAVHGWMEGHLAAPGHVTRGVASSERMSAPPFPRADSGELAAIVQWTADTFREGEDEGAAAAAAGVAWRYGRQEGLDCPGCCLPHAGNQLAQDIRAGRMQVEFIPRPT